MWYIVGACNARPLKGIIPFKEILDARLYCDCEKLRFSPLRMTRESFTLSLVLTVEFIFVYKDILFVYKPIPLYTCHFDQESEANAWRNLSNSFTLWRACNARPY